MLRSVAIVASVLLTCGGTRTAVNYLRTAGDQIAQTISERIPASFDLERLKLSANDLLPHIAYYRRSIETLRITIATYESTIAALDKRQELARQEMDVLRGDIGSSHPTVTHGGKLYTRAELSSDLLRRLDAYERSASDISRRRTQLNDLVSLLEQSTEAVDALSVRRSMLLERYEHLKATMLVAELDRAVTPNADVAHALSAAEEFANSIEAKIRTQHDSRTLAYTGQIPVSAETNTPDSRYDALFGKGH